MENYLKVLEGISYLEWKRLSAKVDEIFRAKKNEAERHLYLADPWELPPATPRQGGNAPPFEVATDGQIKEAQLKDAKVIRYGIYAPYDITPKYGTEPLPENGFAIILPLPDDTAPKNA